MIIWVDADACPEAIKEILYRAAVRWQTKLILISNHAINTPNSPFISKIQVLAGPDVADNKIVQSLQAGDLVITADIPLADQVISKLGIALNPRGEIYTSNNIKERLALRNFSSDLRSTGVITGGPSGLHKRDIQLFANQLDRLLARKPG